MKNDKKVAVVCLCSTGDIVKNIEIAYARTEEAIQAGAEWIVLPEMFSYLGPASGLAEAAEATPRVLGMFQKLADQKNVVIFAGSLPEKTEDPVRVGNVLYVLSPGQKSQSYRKAHLFHLQKENGEVLYSERGSYVAGDTLQSVEVDGWRVALGICYDLRFSGMFNALSSEKPLDVIVLPSAFTQKTGVHWELLLRARAVEWQCYVLGANQFGAHDEQKHSFGHSMVVHPWGEVLADTGPKEGFVMITMKKADVEQAKQAIPVHADRRSEVYL